MVWRGRTGGDWGAKGFLLGVRSFFYLSFFFLSGLSFFLLFQEMIFRCGGGSGLITERALRVIGRSTFFLSE